MPSQESGTRRGFLLGAGAVLFAGCAGSGEEGATASETAAASDPTTVRSERRTRTRTTARPQTQTPTQADQEKTTENQGFEDDLGAAFGLELTSAEWSPGGRIFEVDVYNADDRSGLFHVQLDTVSQEGFAMNQVIWEDVRIDGYETIPFDMDVDDPPPRPIVGQRVFVSHYENGAYSDYEQLYGPAYGVDLPNPADPTEISENRVSDAQVSEYVSLDVSAGHIDADANGGVPGFENEVRVTNESDRWLIAGFNGQYVSVNGVPIGDESSDWISPLAPGETFLSVDVQNATQSGSEVDRIEVELANPSPLDMPPQSNVLEIEDTEVVNDSYGELLRAEVRNTGSKQHRVYGCIKLFAETDGDSDGGELVSANEEWFDGATDEWVGAGDSVVVGYYLDDGPYELYIYDERIATAYNGYFRTTGYQS